MDMWRNRGFINFAPQEQRGREHILELSTGFCKEK
jgi:hypothetical protein